MVTVCPRCDRDLGEYIDFLHYTDESRTKLCLPELSQEYEELPEFLKGLR